MPKPACIMSVLDCVVEVLFGGTGSSSLGATAVAFEPIESIGHGKFWYFVLPLASVHLNISAVTNGDTRNNAIKRHHDLVMFESSPGYLPETPADRPAQRH